MRDVTSSAEETLTFLGTDIEGSTRLLEQLGPRFDQVIADHHRILRTAFATHHGREQGTEGDSFMVVFRDAASAVAAAVDSQLALHSHKWSHGSELRVRMGIHSGEARSTINGYVGLPLHQTGRVRAAAHGGEVLVSQTTLDMLAGPLPDRVTAVGLGSHRLKDLGQPVLLHRLVHADLLSDFPPPRTLDSHPHNLPVQATSFVGREDEVRELTELLAGARLLTLTGAGGSGKTRLALQLAADRVHEYPDGVWLCDLATTREPRAVERTVRSSIGVESGGPDMTLADDLKPLETLVVLDNCEHVLEECAELAEAIVASCPKVRLLATSREPLHSSGEIVWRVPSLGFPSDEEAVELGAVSSYPAVQLFVDRARAVGSRFELGSQDAAAAADICRRLDGLPLAIELAAARTRSMSPSDLASRLDDRFRLLTGGRRRAMERQQTLRAAIDWSHDLLPGAEQVLLRRLAVFSGPFSLDLAEAVCSGDGIDPDGVVDHLDHLVDASLVVPEDTAAGTRYRLLETIRQYAQERLVQVGEAAVLRDRHLDAHVAQIQRGRKQHSDLQWNHGLVEYANFRAAWSWANETGRRSLIPLLGVGMYPYWWEHASPEGGEWIAEMLEVIEAGQTGPGEAAFALVVASHWARWVPSDFVLALQLVERGIPLAEEAGADGNLAWLLVIKGLSIPSAEERVELLERALHLAVPLEVRMCVAMAHWGLGMTLQDVARQREHMREAVEASSSSASSFKGVLLRDAAVVEWRAGDPARAQELAAQAMKAAFHARTMVMVAQGIAAHDPELGRQALERSLEMMGTRRHGIRPAALMELANLHMGAGRIEEARREGERAVAAAREMSRDDVGSAARSLLAQVALMSGDVRGAGSWADAALGQAGSDVSRRAALHAKAGVDLADNRLESAADALAEALQLVPRLSANQYPRLPVLELMVRVEAAAGRAGRAAVLLGWAESIRSREAVPMPPADRPVSERLQGDLRRELGEQAYSAAVSRGAGMTPDEATAFALNRE